MDRETSFFYCTSFISWMKSGFKENNKLLKQTLDFERAFNTLTKSYEDEIAGLKDAVNFMKDEIVELKDAAAL